MPSLSPPIPKPKKHKGGTKQSALALDEGHGLSTVRRPCPGSTSSYHHLGPKIDQEPFRLGPLWRYRWDPVAVLAISRRAQEKRPTWGTHNPSVDRLIVRIAKKRERRAK